MAGRGIPNGGVKRCFAGDRLVPTRTTCDLGFGLHQHLKTQDPESVVAKKFKIDGPNPFKEFLKRELYPAKSQNDRSTLGFSLKSVLTERDPNTVAVPASSYRKDISLLRRVSSKAERILEAPNLHDEFFVRPIDWSANGLVLVVLGDDVWSWQSVGDKTEVQLIGNLCDRHDTVGTTVSCDERGKLAAVGTRFGEIHVFDVEAQRRILYFEEKKGPVASLAWNGNTLSSGAKVGQITHYDLRTSGSPSISTTKAHKGEWVYGLKWSPDSRYLAASVDDVVTIWSAGGSGCLLHGSKPVTVFKEHKSAVKALAWCPWNGNTLASGGGNEDKTIRLWNVSSGALRKECVTDGPVTSLIWSKEYHEIISAHGCDEGHMLIWKLPDFDVVARLEGHGCPITEMSLSADKTTVVTSATDEMLKIWRCFPVDEKRKKEKLKEAWKRRSSPYNMIMR